MVDIAVSVASKVAEFLVAPVGRHCGYVIFSNSHVSQLNDEVQNLGDARDVVQHSIDEANNNMKPIETKVEKWVKEVETLTNKARAVLRYNTRAKKTCFCGWLPNPKARHRLGREASKTVEDIRALISRGKFEKVYYEGPPTGLVTGTPDVNSSASDRGGTISDSRASIFQGIMKALDDEKHKLIGVYGPGGVGKTTLLEEVEKKLRKEGRPFHMIAKSKVSQNPDLKKIQDDIAYALGLNLNEMSDEGRRDLLFQRLQKDPTEKVLMILDDLWKKLDLREVGIPSGDENRGCQVLLTSRFKDVLQKTSASPIFHLEGLKDDEALMLFEKTVGNRLQDNEELKAIAPQVVKKLAGLPLLIKSVATFLKDSNASAWRNASIKIDAEEMETIVKLSCDHLKSEDTKSLFLVCGLIGGTIQVETLFILGMGLGLFGEFGRTMRDARDRLNVMLNELRSACLLLDDDDDKEKVTIHDLYSEVVVSTPFRDQNSLMLNSNYGLLSKEKLEKCWAICLVNVVGDRLVELMRGGCPYLKILMSSQPEAWYGGPAHRHDDGDCCRMDFTNKKELRVLYLRSMHIPTLPPSIEILENLRSLYLDNCEVKDVAILGELEALQILSFAGSSISSLPKEIGKLTNLKLLNLSNCRMLKKIEHGVLKNLINLEELYLQGSFNGWMSEATLLSESCHARLAELKNLTKLTTLEISIPDPTLLLKDGDLPFGNLIRFWINIGKAEKGKFEGLTTMELNLRGCDDIISKEWVQKTLQKTQCLLLDGLRDSKKSAHELCSRGFPKLKHLDIQNCSSIQHIVSSSNGAFPILESLFLKNLINLDKISDGPECFSQLKVIEVTKCNRLENLWRLAKMPRLAQLEKIAVCKCDSVRAIVIDDKRKDAVVAENRVELPNLHVLVLANLPKMMSFCIEAGITLDGAPIQVWFPRLEFLEMNELLDLEKILYGQPPLEYINLKWIQIWNSKSTSSILKSDWILKLPNLESLEIRGSPWAEVVFDLEELKGTGHVEILSRLTELQLYYLPDLQHMCKENAQLKGISVFRNLGVLQVSDTGLAFLFPVSMAKCLREIKYIEVKRCENMEAVVVDEDGGDEGTNDIIEFPLLEQLDIIDCPMMKSFSYFRGKKELVPITSYSQDVYSDSLFDPKVSLPSLEELCFRSVGSFKSIWPRELPQSSFDNLVCLHVLECSQLLNVFPSSVTGRLHNLEVLVVRKIGLAFLFPVSVAKCLRGIRSIEVRDCEKMEALVVDEDGGDEGTNDIIEFPLLERLDIIDCPMMKSFSYFRGKKESVPITSDSQDAYSDSFFDPKVSLPSLEELEFESARSFKSIWPRELPQCSFDNFAKLRVSKCSELLNVFSSTITRRLHNLTLVVIEGCPSLETVFECGPLDSNTTEQTGIVPVSEAIRLSHVVKSDSQTVLALPNLEKVNVNGCPKLRCLFPYAVATTLEKLKQLEITCCKQMKEVVAKEEGGQSKADMLTFPFLTSLSISRCPNFRAFGPNPTSVERPTGEMAKENDESQQPLFSGMVTFPSLNEVKIGGVQVKELWSNQTHDDSFCKLRRLELMECENLQCIAPSDVWKRLQRSLKILEVKSCRSIEIIYKGDATVAETGQLRSLILHDLENLRYIWRYDSLPNINIPFPNLRDVEVRRCPRLRVLFETFTASFLGQIKWLEVESCDDMELIADHGDCEGATRTTITFSKLDVLKLKEMLKFRGYLPEKYHVEFPSHMRALIRVGCGKELDQSDDSDLDGWERHRFSQRYWASRG